MELATPSPCGRWAIQSVPCGVVRLSDIWTGRKYKKYMRKEKQFMVAFADPSTPDSLYFFHGSSMFKVEISTKRVVSQVLLDALLLKDSNPSGCLQEWEVPKSVVPWRNLPELVILPEGCMPTPFIRRNGWYSLCLFIQFFLLPVLHYATTLLIVWVYGCFYGSGAAVNCLVLWLVLWQWSGLLRTGSKMLQIMNHHHLAIQNMESHFAGEGLGQRQKDLEN